jgi:hypothetical protein
MQELKEITDEKALEEAIDRLLDLVTQYQVEMDSEPSFVAHTYLSYYKSQLRILNALETRLDKYSTLSGNLGVLYPDEIALARSIVGLSNV